MTLPIASARGTWRWVRGALGRRRLEVAGTLAVGLAGAAAAIVPVSALGVLVDRVRAGASPSALAVIGAVIGAAALGAGLTAGLAAYLVARTGGRLLATLREATVERALRLPSATLEHAGRGDLLARVGPDVAAVHRVVSEILPTMINSVLLAVLSLATMAGIDWRLGLAAAVSLPLYVLGLRWYLPRSAPGYRQQRIAIADRARLLVESMLGRATVHAYRLEERHRRGIDAASARARDVEYSVFKLFTRLVGRVNRAEFAGVLAIVVAGYFLVRAGHVTVGETAAAAVLFHRLFNPIGGLLFSAADIQAAGAALARLVGVLEVPIARTATATATATAAATAAGGAHAAATSAGDARTADAGTAGARAGDVDARLVAVDARGVDVKVRAGDGDGDGDGDAAVVDPRAVEVDARDGDGDGDASVAVVDPRAAEVDVCAGDGDARVVAVDPGAAEVDVCARDGDARVGDVDARAVDVRVVGVDARAGDVDELHSAHVGAVNVDFRQVGLMLRDVTFAYDDGTDVLHGVTLHVAPGTRVALVGSTGAGKSTLAAIAAGLLHPRSGTVTVGGHPPSTARVAVVTQETHVFAGPLVEDLRLARPGATDAEVAAALATVDALDWARDLPEGLRTVVGEGGHPLTAAQAQQLALARVVLADPPVAVLDEATAEAGSLGARHLETSALAATAGRTTLVVAHRLTQAATADRIVVLDGGRVVEEGTHAELVAADGAYARLWRAWETR
ncbi:ABC transporter ATP-binding protein [Dactylosporangium sp. CA-139114]|uniref:ABC transporter ATP-binding protein n=1 Tax=Dactylosporangium sp. CA-139114 TaxID=3239931 RepID=UPI003D99C41F